MLNEVGGLALARHVRSPLVLTAAQMLDVAGQLSAAGIVGHDMVTSINVLLMRVPDGLNYDPWRTSLVALRAGKTDAEVDAELMRTYGNDAVRAANVLSRRDRS